MAGTVVYPKDNRKGCQSFEGIPYNSKPGALPNFGLLDHGVTLFLFSSNCLFSIFLWILHWCLKLIDWFSCLKLIDWFSLIWEWYFMDFALIFLT